MDWFVKTVLEFYFVLSFTFISYFVRILIRTWFLSSAILLFWYYSWNNCTAAFCLYTISSIPTQHSSYKMDKQICVIKPICISNNRNSLQSYQLISSKIYNETVIWKTFNRMAFERPALSITCLHFFSWYFSCVLSLSPTSIISSFPNCQTSLVLPRFSSTCLWSISCNVVCLLIVSPSLLPTLFLPPLPCICFSLQEIYTCCLIDLFVVYK